MIAGGWVADVDWSPSGEHLAALVIASDDGGAVTVLDRTGETVATLHEQSGQKVTSVRFSADGRRLVTTREGLDRVVPGEMHVTVWDWETGDIVSTIDTSAAMVAIDPTGRTIATSRRVETKVDVWDASTGDRLATLAAPVQVTAVEFSADGARIATAHTDGSSRVWEVATGVQQLSLAETGVEVVALAFSPDGMKLASNDADGVTRVWALDVDDLVAIAEDRRTRGFTDDECRQYLHRSGCSTS